jgi:hypothetical protein
MKLNPVMMFAIFGQVTINDTMVASYTSDAWRSRAYAIRYFMSFGARADFELVCGRCGRLAALVHQFDIRSSDAHT